MQSLTSLNHLLTEFYDKFSSWEQSVVKDSPYTLAQLHTVEVLGNHGPMRMKELAEKLAISTGTLTVQVDKLVNAGLIERRAQQDDRRAIVVALSDQGLQVHHYHNQRHLELVADLTRHIDAPQLAVLTDSLQKMNREF